MAAVIPYKATALRDELASKLAVRLSASAPTIAKSFSANQEPQLSIGALTSDSDSVLIQLTVPASPFTDVLGLTQNVWAPMIAQVVVEAAATSATWLTRLSVLVELMAGGMQVKFYERTHGTGILFTDIAAGNLKATIDVQPQYPLMGQ